MKLGDYLKREGITHAAFAEELGVTRSAVTQWVNDLTLPTGERMIMVYRMSGGEVGMEDWHIPAERGK